MPRAQKGQRFGGRQKGSLNKATLERAFKAARAVEVAAQKRVKLAKEVLEDFLPVLAGMAAFYQPTFPGMAQQNQNGNAAEFEQWLRLTIEIAKQLAPYQSPTFRAINVHVGPATPEPKTIEGNVIPLHDPQAAAAAYRRMVTASRK